MSDETTGSSEPVFRASKRRRIVRRKQDGNESDDSTPLQTQPPLPPISQVTSQSLPDEVAQDGSDVFGESTKDGAPIRQRKPIMSKRGGIAFSSLGKQRDLNDNKQDSSEGQALVPAINVSEIANSRFMAPTGQTVSIDDKHMMAYIDSKLATIHSRSAAATPITNQSPTPSGAENDTPRQHVDSPNPSVTNTPRQRIPSEDRTQPVTQPQAQMQPISRPKPPRLGRDGKPLRPRKDRNRRTSFDITRDAMVEQVLRESRLEIYEEPVRHTSAGVTAAGLDEAADERMAAEFRREFIASMEERNSRRPPPPPPSGKGDPLKGPKLGGSRSQRAAMRAMEEKAAKSKP